MAPCQRLGGYVAMFIMADTLPTLAHIVRFSPFFGLFFNPCFVFLGLLLLFAILRRRDRYGNHRNYRGGGYYRGGPWYPGPGGQATPPPPAPQDPQNPSQTAGGYGAPYSGYGNPGNAA